MQMVKGMALGLVGFFLFMTLPLLGLLITVNNTALNSDFIVKEVRDLDLTKVAREIIMKQSDLNDPIYIAAIDKTLTDLRPWINRELKIAADTGYDYLLGRTPVLDISISTEDIEPTIIQDLTAIYLKSPPEGYKELSAAEQQKELASFQDSVQALIPPQIEIKEADLPPDVLQALAQAKDTMGTIRIVFFVLIALSLILAFLVFYILREIKAVILAFGVILLVEGALTGIAILILNYVVPRSLSFPDLPATIQAWIPRVIHDALYTWGVIGLIFSIVGTGLIVLFLWLRRKHDLQIPIKIYG